MGGLSSLLYVGASGLSASQHGVQTASDNITNVDTPGFHRRVALQSTRNSYPVNGVNQGAGVNIDGTQRVIDRVLARRLLDAGSEVGFSTGRADVLRQAESIFGDLEGHGLTSALDEFFGALDQLATEPQDTGARSRVLAAAEQFAATANFVASEVRTLQSEIDVQIEEQVVRINELSAEIADLNNRIGGLVTPPADLLDRRDAAVDELSGMVGVSVVESDNRVTVSLRGSGYGLVVDGIAESLSSSVSGGAVVITGDRAGAPLDLTNSLSGGSLAGTIEARNVDLQATSDRVDQFAFDFATAVNALHAGGAGTDGVAGRDLFAVPGTATDAALMISVDPSVAGRPDRVAAAQDPSLVPGDNRNAVALADLRNGPLAGGETAGATVGAVLADFGARLSSATNSVEAQSALQGHMLELRDSISGVSLDEEMTKLLQYRQSYSAAARVVRTADELMQEVIGMKR